MKILLLLLLAIQLFSDVRSITGKRILVHGNWNTTETIIKDYCIDGFVWRQYYGTYQGSLSQVFINKDGKTLAKKCKENK